MKKSQFSEAKPGGRSQRGDFGATQSGEIY